MGHDNPKVRVRGDAVVVRRRGAVHDQGGGRFAFVADADNRLGDLTYAQFDAQFGLHGILQPQGSDNEAFSWVLPNTKEGLAVQMEMAQMLVDVGRAPNTR